MKVHILDDWFDTLRGLPCFSKLDGHDVTVWTDHLDDTDALAARLKDAEVLVLFRERTKVTRKLLEKLPNLRLISQRGTYPHIDVQACVDHNVMLCSKIPSGGGVNYAAAELTWALIMMGMRDLPNQMASVKAGNWQSGVGKTLPRKASGPLWLWAHCQGCGRVCGSFWNADSLVGVRSQPCPRQSRRCHRRRIPR